MTTNISPTSIVVEVLRDDNYDDWSACMRSYMLAHDLWDLLKPVDHDQEGDQEVDSTSTDHREGDQEVDSTSTDSTSTDHREGDQEVDSTSTDSTSTDHREGDQEVDSTSTDSTSTDHREGEIKVWRKKNAAALHAIQISCSPRILSKIRSIVIAKDAWDTLANLQSDESELSESSQGSGAVSDEMNGPLQALYRHAHKGDWDATKDYLKKYPNAIRAKIEPYGRTALHVAARAGNLEVVEELVKLMSEKELEILDNYGDTALSCAARVGITKMAECLVSKNHNLVTLVNDEDKRIPLVEACLNNNKDMALYLYSVTPFKFLCQDNGIHGSFFLRCAIGAQMLDIAYDFLYRYPNMTTTRDDADELNALRTLSMMPGIFPSGNRLALWQQWIYSCIRLPPIDTPDQIFCIYMPDQRLSGSKNITLRVLSKLHGFAINLLTFLGIKKIYDMKKMHIYSDKILQCMCEHLSKLDYEKLLEENIDEAFQRAVKEGMVEFIIELIKVCPQLMTDEDDNERNLFMSSIAYRHEKVFNLLHGLDESIATIVSLKDSSKNTLLHLAAKLSPPSQLAQISGAALQMQRELQWYKEVERIISPTLMDHCNKNNQTARELFTNDHKDLLVKGEEWMKGSATSCTVVGALIITIMFTVAFTVPGGNVQETGYPVFKDEKSFTVFIVADAISLFSSSTSVLMFLGILTSRYAEEDFLKSLPTKLILGLSTLFLSIAAMMVTFCAALIIMLNGRLEVVIPVVLLASIPITFFMLLQFPLLVKIYMSTYGSGIFNKKMKRWY